ncbi:MAG: hypothetical protein M3Y54_20995 [Bacteroidota bacterium]|nr:hypothetical protein [Bacteroidota bacterium]
MPLLGAGCTLTSTEVEPDLPTGQVNGGSTLVFRADGLPVVTQNYTDIGTVLSSIFADPRGVSGRLSAGNVLTIYAADIQNPISTTTNGHSLRLTLNGFHGTATYQLMGFDSDYQETTHYQSAQTQFTILTFFPAPTTTPQVTVSQWDPLSRRLQGTFAFTAVANGSSQPVALTDGRFDVTIDP